MNKLISDRGFWYRAGIYSLLIAVFGYIAYQYAAYMDIAKSTVPIMDFWEWIYVYGQKIVDGSVTFADFFNSDAGQHIQPVCMAINFWVLGAFDFDVVPLVVGGMIFRFVIAALLVILFLYRFKDARFGDMIVQFMCAIVIIMSILNYNQWEMTSEPFALTNAFRVGNYLLTFYLADVFLKGLGTRGMKVSLLKGGLLGVYCAFLTVFVGAAYFVGHLVAIGLAMLYTLVRQRKQWKCYFWPMALWAGISFVSACVYYILVRSRSAAGTPMVEAEEYIRLIIEGVSYFWGSMFVHTNDVSAYGLTWVAVLGTLIFIYAVYITVRYLSFHADGKGMLPVICVAYALIMSVAVSFGRVTVWGSKIMTSSRYVTESVIGIIGVIWMSYDLYASRERKKVAWIRPVACSVTAILLMISVIEAENAIAPYRRIYNENLHEMMTHLEDYSDDQLASFQANSPEYVRYSVEFFEEYGLSIFSENP